MYVGKVTKRRHFGFVEIAKGLWYEESTGLPWSSKKFLGTCFDFYNKLKRNIGTINGGYFLVTLEGKRILWHRLVYEFFNDKIPEGMDVDHKDNNPTNNKIDNLQLLSHKDNSRFRKKSKANKSGYPGVCWHKRDKKWQACITVNKKLLHLGYFDDPAQAHDAYIAAKIKYHGEESIRVM